ncbi:MAG TPA: glycoside hydrolase family 3 N-terminal domain-containing protein, partial [Sphaerochaetaceae bacterium]|nr:glycoside hydrolase family 3 N-terminal domain-containing protein [Sphaerochaetaceae bacterium]
MFNHLKRQILQHLMNRYFLKLRPVPEVEADTTEIHCSVPPGPNRVDQLLSRMTMQEKIDYISGVNGFSVRAVKRLGLPPVWMSDATSGVRGVDAPVTVFPSPIAMAATWNRSLLKEVGRSIGRECRATGVSILLAPGVNIARVPVCGRNFEYLGEDP